MTFIPKKTKKNIVLKIPLTILTPKNNKKNILRNINGVVSSIRKRVFEIEFSLLK